MARIRQIKPGFNSDEDLAEHGPWHRLLFAGLWTLADRDGRLEDRPSWIRVSLFPYDNLEAQGVSVNVILDDLAKPRKHSPEGGGFIVRYEVNGRRYIQVRNFNKHQKPHKNEAPSVIPPVPGGWLTPAIGGTTPDIGRTSSADSGFLVLGSGVLGSGKNGNEPSPADAGAALGPPTPPEEKPWSVEACDDWETNLGSVGSMGGRIGKALKPLLGKHGWGTVRELWQRACEQAAAEADPEYFTPEVFARTFQARMKAPTPRSRGRPSVGERQLAAAAEFIRGKGGGS